MQDLRLFKVIAPYTMLMLRNGLTVINYKKIMSSYATLNTS